MFCHKCGTEMPDESLFCRKCGTRLLPDSSAAIRANSVPPETSKPSVVADVAKIGCILASLQAAPYVLPGLALLIIGLLLVVAPRFQDLRYTISRSEHLADSQTKHETDLSYIFLEPDEKARKAGIQKIKDVKRRLMDCKTQPQEYLCRDEFLDKWVTFFPARKNFLAQIRTAESRQTYRQQLLERYRIAIYRAYKWNNYDDAEASRTAADFAQSMSSALDSRFAQLEQYIAQYRIQIFDEQQFRAYLISKGYSPDEVRLLLDTVEP